MILVLLMQVEVQQTRAKFALLMSLDIVRILIPDVLQSGGSKTHAISLKTLIKGMRSKLMESWYGRGIILNARINLHIWRMQLWMLKCDMRIMILMSNFWSAQSIITSSWWTIMLALIALHKWLVILRKIIQQMEWLMYSLDWNPIEYVWDALRRRLASQQFPLSTLQKLQGAIYNGYTFLPNESLDNNLIHMENRCKGCIL